MNLRQLVGIDEPYFRFDREERHLAGILFHILNYKENAQRALHSANRNWNINPEEFGIYLEYSHPRDLWNKMEVKTESNERKRQVIVEMLGSHGFDTTILASLSRVESFNTFFIGPRGSREYIESPANWSLTQLTKSLPSKMDDDDLVTACKIKWAFRAKPDIVIHADRGHALCLELKLESTNGSYPSSGIEKKLMGDRGLFARGGTARLPMSQLILQKFLMTKLLGIDCHFRLITRHATSSDESVSWGDFLRLLEPLPNPPIYIEAALKNVQDRGVAATPSDDEVEND